MYLEDFEAAQQREEVFTSRRRTITETDGVLFTSLTGIIDPVFTDEIFAKEQLFGARVVPGPMVMAYALGMTDDFGYGTILAALAINNATFKAPVKPGDTIQATTRVADTRRSETRPNTGIIRLAHSVTNQDGIEVQNFERTLLVLARAAE